MKLTLFSILLILFLAINGYAQETKVPQLYWVVETNIHHRNCTIVRFYNKENQKVHEVTLMGVHIDIRVPKQRRKLDQLLKEHIERVETSLQRTSRTV
jgi:hypothetical protein